MDVPSPGTTRGLQVSVGAGWGWGGCGLCGCGFLGRVPSPCFQAGNNPVSWDWGLKRIPKLLAAFLHICRREMEGIWSPFSVGLMEPREGLELQGPGSISRLPG